VGEVLSAVAADVRVHDRAGGEFEVAVERISIHSGVDEVAGEGVVKVEGAVTCPIEAAAKVASSLTVAVAVEV
jgi:hypothetical protein